MRTSLYALELHGAPSFPTPTLSFQRSMYVVYVASCRLTGAWTRSFELDGDVGCAMKCRSFEFHGDLGCAMKRMEARRELMGV